MSNSPLVSYTKLSPNHSGKRKHAIDTISIHCMAGNLSVERCGELFQNKERQASSNYGIGSDGRIGLYVDEANRSWCTSSASNDNRAVTIEVANTVAKDPWPVSDAAYKSLIDLLVDICQRNGIPRLLWKGDKNLVGQVDRQNMTVHRWFAAKACPGDWLYSRHGQIAAEVNKRLEAAKAGKDEETMDTKQLTSCADTGDNPPPGPRRPPTTASARVSSPETVRATTDGRSPSPARPRPRSSTICWRPPVCWRSCRT